MKELDQWTARRRALAAGEPWEESHVVDGREGGNRQVTAEEATAMVEAGQIVRCARGCSSPHQSVYHYPQPGPPGLLRWANKLLRPGRQLG